MLSADGLHCESLLRADQTKAMLTVEDLTELRPLFPEMMDRRDGPMPAARLSLKPWDPRYLIGCFIRAGEDGLDREFSTAANGQPLSGGRISRTVAA